MTYMTTVMATGGSIAHHALLSKGERKKNSTHEELPWRWREKGGGGGGERERERAERDM